LGSGVPGDFCTSVNETNWHFAELENDFETSTEHAQFRQYSPAQGHWMSPDPYSGSYDFTNPQSMNRYSYVLNNPLSFIDPPGLMLCSVVGGGSWGVSTDDGQGNVTVDSWGDSGSLICTDDGPGNPGTVVAPNKPPPKNGWDWDEKPHWPAPSTTRQQPFGQCFNGAMKLSSPGNGVTVVSTASTLWGLFSPNPVSKTVGATNALFNFGRIFSSALVCSSGDAYFAP
jgi:RHS repeat-associated protein